MKREEEEAEKEEEGREKEENWKAKAYIPRVIWHSAGFEIESVSFPPLSACYSPSLLTRERATRKLRAKRRRADGVDDVFIVIMSPVPLAVLVAELFTATLLSSLSKRPNFCP